ncbi:hypothetical protein [Wolbachia endosymbiont (group A) of Udea olivalis]|uniref:hypothetical protein n=1 Tax=Wolbachia endosymbiont (group A) of Udea olivalis TaxID=3066183 RepID=UPI00313307F1
MICSDYCKKSYTFSSSVDLGTFLVSEIELLSEGLIFRLEEVSIKDTVSVLLVNIYASIIFNI